KFANVSPISELRTGLILAQGGEFGLFLLAVALDKHVIDLHSNQIVIAAIVISMAVSPLLIRKSEMIATFILKCLGKGGANDQTEDLSNAPKNQEDHVIICGYGRVGQTLARFLEYEGIP
ncbi:MAG TPA: hypothetical protein PLD88_06415, partial [Candidatus Berkiella sp.]|nr:hypothetical protein [Candidatus Berkiella sp.]